MRTLGTENVPLAADEGHTQLMVAREDPGPRGDRPGYTITCRQAPSINPARAGLNRR